MTDGTHETEANDEVAGRSEFALLGMRFYLVCKIILGWGLIITAILKIAFIRFSFPEMTETQLLINFWADWIITFLMCISGVYVLQPKRI